MTGTNVKLLSRHLLGICERAQFVQINVHLIFDFGGSINRLWFKSQFDGINGLGDCDEDVFWLLLTNCWRLWYLLFETVALTAVIHSNFHRQTTEHLEVCNYVCIWTNFKQKNKTNRTMLTVSMATHSTITNPFEWWFGISTLFYHVFDLIEYAH